MALVPSEYDEVAGSTIGLGTGLPYLGHGGECCGKCAAEIVAMHEKITQLHTMVIQFAESMSKLGENPMTRTMMRSMGIKLPEMSSANGGSS